MSKESMPDGSCIKCWLFHSEDKPCPESEPEIIHSISDVIGNMLGELNADLERKIANE